MSYKDYPLSADTTPEAEQVLFDLLGKKTPAEKLQMVSRMNSTVRSLARAGLRARYPSENDLQLKFRLAELLYGIDVANKIALRLAVSLPNE
jgi:hypothetical protein